MTRFGADFELLDPFDAKQAKALRLYERYYGSPGGGSWFVACCRDLEKLNAALAALAINVVVLDPYADDEENDDDWLEGGVSA